MTFMESLLKRSLVCLTFLMSANSSLAQPIMPSGAIAYSYEVIAERHHDQRLFTQGLVLDQGNFYESSGLYKQSLLVSYPLEAAAPQKNTDENFIQKTSLPPQYFAEGLTLFNNKLYLLTWREQTLMIINRETFALEKTLRYTGQGWGLTSDTRHLIRSDGSHRLFFHSPDNFAIVRTLQVYKNMQPMERLNELEYIDGKVWANIWYENRLVEIDPNSGRVTGYVDLSALVESLQLTNNEQVLNGIAYDSTRDALWVTGKLWPKMFLIRLIKTSPADQRH